MLPNNNGVSLKLCIQNVDDKYQLDHFNGETKYYLTGSVYLWTIKF